MLKDFSLCDHHRSPFNDAVFDDLLEALLGCVNLDFVDSEYSIFMFVARGLAAPDQYVRQIAWL